MSSNNNSDAAQELNDGLIDNSINDARWLLGGVAIMFLIVFGFGLLASTLAV